MEPTWAVWFCGQESGGNSQPPRAALSCVYRPGQHGGAGAAVSPRGDGHPRAVGPDPGAANRLEVFQLEQNSWMAGSPFLIIGFSMMSNLMIL